MQSSNELSLWHSRYICMYFVAYTVSGRYSSEGNKPLEKSGGSPLQSLPQSCTTLENYVRINIVFTCCTERKKTKRSINNVL
jgi:hypothetical protein